MAEIFTGSGFWVSFYIIHGLLLLLIGPWAIKRVEPEKAGAIVIIVSLSLFIPVIGELFGGLALMASKMMKTDKLMEDYDKMISARVVNYEPLRHEAAENEELISIVDGVTSESSEVRKKTILRHIDRFIPQQGKYLKMGLGNKDQETVHYAATMMNALLDQYEGELKKAKQEVVNGDSESMRCLSSAYRRYIESELLSDVIKNGKLAEWIKMLKKAFSEFPEEGWVYEHLSEAYRLNGNETESVRIIEAEIQHFPDRPAGYFRLVRYHFEQDDWTQLNRIFRRMQQLFKADDIPKDYRFAFEQLKGDDQWKRN